MRSAVRRRLWHLTSVGAVQRYVRSWGQIGSDRPNVKTALLTQKRHWQAIHCRTSEGGFSLYHSEDWAVMGYAAVG
jgi:hypothetical protein